MRTLDGPQRGKRGNIVASRNRSGQFLRERVKPANPRTPAQRRARKRMGEVSRRWSRLTEEQRRAWWAVAGNIRSQPRLGQSGPLDGQKLFVKINTVLAICGREPLTDPPPLPTFAPNPVAAFTITKAHGAVALKLSLSAPPTADIMVFGSPPCNAGRSYCSNFSFLGLLPAPVEYVSNFTRLYLKKYGVPRAGSRVFIRAVQQVNGWEDRLHTEKTSALVPARERAAAGQRARPIGISTRATQGQHKGSTREPLAISSQSPREYRRVSAECPEHPPGLEPPGPPSARQMRPGPGRETGSPRAGLAQGRHRSIVIISQAGQEPLSN